MHCATRGFVVDVRTLDLAGDLHGGVSLSSSHWNQKAYRLLRLVLGNVAVFELGAAVPGLNGVVNTGISRAGMGHIAIVYQHLDMISLCTIVLLNANLLDLVENFRLEDFAVGDTASHKVSGCLFDAGLNSLVEAFVARAAGGQGNRNGPALDDDRSDLECCRHCCCGWSWSIIIFGDKR